MKTIILLIVGMICSLSAIAQQVYLNSFVSVDVPKGAEIITNEKALAYSIKKHNNDGITAGTYNPAHSRYIYIYKIDEILVTLYAANKSLKLGEDHILKLKKGLDGLSQGDSTYKSSLKKINNNSVITENYISGNVEYYRFYCYKSDNTRAITGKLEFDKADYNEATDILNHVLNSIEFK
jgi:hypothetical protein